MFAPPTSIYTPAPGLRWKMDIPFVDIIGIIDNYFLHFLFIIYSPFCNIRQINLLFLIHFYFMN